MRLGAILAVASAAWPAAAAAADEEPICADRPGVATPTCTVPAGKVQVETGIADWTHDRFDGARIDALAIGASALKVGVTDRLHLELDIAPFEHARVREAGASESLSGFGDTAIAFKYRLTGDSAPLQLAVHPFVKFPTARYSIGNGRVEGGIAFPIGYSIPGSQFSITLDPELDANADVDGSGHHLATQQVISLGFPLAARLSASAEAWGYWDFDPLGTVRQYGLAGSAAYLVSNDVQLDAGVMLGLNRTTPDVELYTGFALRF